MLLQALKSGKPVVSANKELLANHGGELWEAAGAAGVDLLFEASVAGGIPLIRALRQSLAGERIHRVMGIVNGTTNYILSRMTAANVSYQEALAEAQSLGYAERDPTADVEGYDAAAKAAILANVAFGAKVVAGDVYREGIAGIGAQDIEAANRLGFVIKLLAVIESSPDGALASGSTPPWSPGPPAGVGAGLVQCRVHRGRRRRPTDVAGPRRRRAADGQRRARRPGGCGPQLDGQGAPASSSSARCRSALSMTCAVRTTSACTWLTAPASWLRFRGRSAATMSLSVRWSKMPPNPRRPRGRPRQPGQEGEAHLMFVTHPAYERDIQACLHELRQLDAVRRIGGWSAWSA